MRGKGLIGKNKSQQILFVCFSIVLSAVLISSLFPTLDAFSAGSTPVAGQATFVNSGGVLDFNSAPYNSSVAISNPDPNSNNTRTLTGFAWSEDFGWVDFGSGPVAVDYDTGKLSGQAEIINTGGHIDFNNYNSDAYIDPETGDFAGFGWSVDGGWIDFSGVYVDEPNSLSYTVGESVMESSIVPKIIADDTTEWVFQAKVTDENGLDDVDYVDLRLANDSDEAQPYESIVLRWDRETDSFSEVSDTQSAITLTSTATDSTSSGSQWTLDFKFKVNSSFSLNDTPYSAEVQIVANNSNDDTANYADFYQVEDLALTLTVDNSTIEFGNLLPGSVATGTTRATVTCNHPNGYSLSVHDSVAGTMSALLHAGDSSTRVADYAATVTTPTLWSGTGLGISVYSATGKNTEQWGGGTSESDSNNKYAGVPETATVIHEKTGSPTDGDETAIGYKVVVPNTQKTGSYCGDIIYTATGAID